MAPRGCGSHGPGRTGRIARSLAATALLVASGGCGLIPTEPVVYEPNVPTTFAGRPVEVQGTIELSSPNVTIYVWDSGQIDGDVVSLALNNRWILQGFTLTGNKYAIHTTLNATGYSYLLLYAHNEGTISPNTAAVSIDDGSGEQVLTLSADLATNSAVNLLVQR